MTKERTRTYFGLDSQWYTINSSAPKAPEYYIEDYGKNSESRNDTSKDRTDIYKYGEKEEDKSTKEPKPLMKKLLALITPLSAKNETIDEKQTAYAAGSSKGTFLFQGRGWGHGIGMSQNGAIGMARNDFSCEEIIKWYYSGVKIEK